MARRKHHKRYGNVVEVALGGLLDTSLSGKDLLIGVGVGLAGAAALKYLAANYADKLAFLPAPVINNLSAVGAVVGGAAAYFVEKKSHKGKAHLVAAASVGAALAAWALVQQQLGFADVVGLQLSGFGLPVDEKTPGLAGLPIDEPRMALAGFAGARDDNMDWAGIGDDWMDA